jgi:tRNA threonylcarbamoyladenosine biosynthesis protein TsaB
VFNCLPILAFDTAQGALSVAVLDGDRVLAHYFESRTHKHAEVLMLVIKKVLKQALLTPADLTALAVTIGPGTFMGLRIGLAAAKGLALARTLPLVGVTTLEAIAAPVIAEEDEVIFATFDAKRGDVYLQAFSSCQEPISQPLISNVDDALAHITPPRDRVVLVGTGGILVAEVLEKNGIICRLAATKSQPDALSIARIANARLAIHGPHNFLVAPAPLYLRTPDAKRPSSSCEVSL